MWDTASGQQLAVFTKNLEMCRVRFSPDGNSIATDSTNYSNLPYKNEEFPPGDSIELWDVATGKNRVILANSFVTGLGDFEFSPDGKMLFITVHEFIARSFFYDLTKEPPDLNFRGGDRPSIPTNAFFAFSADWSMLASFSQEDQITLWDTKTREPIGTLELPKRRKGCSLAFSPNGRWLASGNDDGSLHIWYLNARSLKFAVKDSRQLIRAVAYLPDSRLLAAAGGDSMLRLYNTETGEKLVTIKAHEEYITSMKFSPDGKLIATGSGDRLIKLWDVDALLGRKP